ncbi:sacsin, partial [Tachysurus ichikawai]
TANEESFSVDLNGLPLLLTKDKMLRKFSSNSPKLISQFAYIFNEHKSEFVEYQLTQTQLLDLIRLLVDLRERSDYEDNKDNIALALTDVRFIQYINGCLQLASYFFDDDVNLYEVMLPKHRFIPKSFWELFNNSTRAKSLISSLGLKHKVSEEEVITFAHQIESDAKGDTELQVLTLRSATVLKTALHLGNEKKSKVMQRIATIKFIVAMKIEKELCDYHKAFAQGRDVVAIKGSLLEKQSDHQYLIWTSMPILPSRDFNQKELNALRAAGAFDEPPSEQVMQNLTNICRSQCRTESLVETRAKVFKNSYAYLQSVPFNESVLADVPLVLVENDTNLVKANQVVLALPNADEFRFYLYPIQSKHAVYAEFFTKIGVEEKPTVTQLCTVLNEIYTECCDKTTLQPNQQKTVQRVVQQLFCLINKEKKLTDFQNITLYLPSSDGKLYESSTLFFNDTFFQARRLEDSLKTKLKLLVNLNQCHLSGDPYGHQKLLQLLPKEIQPKLLSQVISVNLVGAHVEHCDYGKSCEFNGWFEKRLSSCEFRHGLICLIREQSNGTISQAKATHMCEKIFGKIQIVCRKTLHTELLLNHQPLEGTETETHVYVEKQQDECVFYLKHNDNMALKVVNEVNMFLTKEINVLLENSLSSLSLLVLGQLLLCENMEDVGRALENHGVRNIVSHEEGLFCPRIGTPIPEEWHDSLDMDLLNNFEKGEYVGFSKDELENEYIFAIVVECLDEYPGHTKRNPSRYRIQIGNEKIIEVSALDLYQFKREKRSSSVGNVTCTIIDILPELSRSKPSQSIPSPKRPLPQTLEEVKIELDQTLEEIWKMSDEDKSKAIRRLYLRWHPDKNPENTELANEAFKYLLKRIEALQQGKTKHNTSAQQNTTHWADFSNFYDRWSYEARSHKRGREQSYQNNFRWQNNFWSHFQETPRPNKEEANRWYRQAQCDLLAAQSDFEYNPNPEWCLFKVHQAVEKALIATEFRRNGKHPGTLSTITSLAQKVSQYAAYLNDLPLIVNQLRALGVDAKRTQYPNCHPSPHIPHEQFKTKDAQEAVKIATKFIRKLDNYITE